jgi:hypothetical protein
MNTTTTRRFLTTAAAAGVLSLGAAFPASAWPDPGAPGSTGKGGATTVRDVPTKIVRNDPSATVVREVLVDDDAVEYAQIALGALTGLAVASAAAVGFRRREQHAPHPA